MKKKIICLFFPLAAGIIFFSCGSNDAKKENEGKDTLKKVFTPNSRESILEKIATFEKQANAPGQTTANSTLAQNLINAYNEFVTYYPKDSLSEKYSFKAADVAINSYANDQAIVLIDKCLNLFPRHPQRLNLLFLKAMIYDDRLNDDARAKLVYEQIIKENPNTPAEAQAKDALKLLGKSDAELIKEFNQKNKGGI